MKLAGIIILILIAALFLGEAVLVLGYIALAIVAWMRCKQRWISASVTVICLTALALHSLGFKLYGRAVVVADRESLTNPKQAVALEPPSKVIFKDGSIIQLPDIFFPKPLNLLEGKTNYHGVFQDAYNIHGQLGHDPYHQEWIDVEVESPSTNISKATCLRKATYWCGNTWFPTFFPRRLPRKLREDLSVALVGAGLALPTAAHAANAPSYWDPLMKALHHGYPMSLPPQHPEVIQLGRFLVDNRPDEFEAGVHLLIEAEDTASYPKLATEIRKRRASKPITVEELSSSFAGLLPWWLLRLDATETLRLMKACQMQSQPDCFVVTQLAESLVQNGDWSGCDYLAALLAKPELDSAYRKSLGARLAFNFSFLSEINVGLAMPEEVSALLPQWYAENRHQLRWIKQPDGGAGFGLNSGRVLDEAYFTTMKNYLVKAKSLTGRL